MQLLCDHCHDNTSFLVFFFSFSTIHMNGWIFILFMYLFDDIILYEIGWLVIWV